MPFRWSQEQLHDLGRELHLDKSEHKARGYEWDVGPVLQVLTLWVQTNPPARRP